MDFVHLHCHTHYSLLDGLAKPRDLVQKALSYKMPALAITDHGAMYGAIDFYQTCKDAGIKPIIGCELYVAKHGHKQKRANIDTKPYHLVALAKNEIGYRNLIKLTSTAHLDGFYYKPRIDYQLFQKHSEGLIILSACLASELASAALTNGKDAAVEVISNWQKLVGQDNYYVELQHHPHIPEQGKLNNLLIEVAQGLQVPIVATNDSHYTNQDDAGAHDVLLCVQTNKELQEKQRMTMIEDDFSLKSPELMAADFSHVPKAIENTLRIAEQCNLEIPFGQNLIPLFTVPHDLSESKYLRQLCFTGLKHRYGIEVSDIYNTKEAEIKECDPNKELPDTAKALVERLEYELGVVDKMGFPGYFLIVWDFIRYAKEQGIFVGPGRGSAAGSLLSYCLGVTDIDPIKYQLLFERFLNPDRISMPDIDIDFEDSRRDEVISYVQKKYGQDRVCQIITFGTMAARAAVKDVGRVSGKAFNEMNELASKIPSKPGTKLAQALEEEAELKEVYKKNNEYGVIMDNALKLEGTIRQAGVHACAVIISKIPLNDIVPLQFAPGDSKVIISQYSMGPLEDLGLLKMDFLGLRNLSILRNAISIIKKRHNVQIDLGKIPLDDQQTFKLFARGDTVGVFQFESAGMRRYLRELKPTVFDDIIAMVALYRPGPMQFIDSFIARKHGREPIKYEHPLMKEALSDTYGITVYQEQVMKLSRDMALFTGGQADTLRKAIGKKKADLMAKMKQEFIDGCQKNNISGEIPPAVWKSWEAFAQYCFNKSHAACYALIAYQTAYLKSHYPAEFMAALMTADQENPDRLVIDIEECQHLGINVLGPNINESLESFTVIDENNIRFGFKAIKNCGKGIIEDVLLQRKESGSFSGFDDLIDRIDPKNFNKKNVESLIKGGALDDFYTRGQLLENLEQILNYSKNLHKQKSSGQVSLFGMSEQSQTRIKLPAIDNLENLQKLKWEKEYLGFYLSDHPFKEFEDKVKKIISPVKNLKNQIKGIEVTVGGIIINSKKLTTKKGDLMMFATLEDLSESIELIIFPRIFKKTESLWLEDNPVVVKGKLSSKDSDLKLIVNDVEMIAEEKMDKIFKKFTSQQFPGYYSADNYAAPSQVEQDIVPQNNNDPTKKVVFTIRNMITPQDIENLKSLLASNNNGDWRVYIAVGTPSQVIQTDYFIQKEPAVIEQLGSIVGTENISYN